jgi:hypothetical protein
MRAYSRQKVKPMIPIYLANGGGTGGGQDNGSHGESVDGSYAITANQVAIVSRPALPPAIPGPSVITVLATGMGTDGLVNVRGSQGVRVSSGLPVLLPTEDPSTSGVEILIDELGKFTLKRGLLPVDQTMEIASDGVKIDAGTGKVTITSLTEITLSVAGGTTKLTLAPEGVTIEALQIKLSAQVQAEIQALMCTLAGSAMTQISGGITMIG